MAQARVSEDDNTTVRIVDDHMKYVEDSILEAGGGGGQPDREGLRDAQLLVRH